MIASALLAVVGALLLVQVVRLKRRLELVARAEHELRGPLGALALGLEAALGRSRPAPELLPGLELQLERARMGLADLGAAREGRRAPADPRRVDLEPFLHAASVGIAATGGPAPAATVAVVLPPRREVDTRASALSGTREIDERPPAAVGTAVRIDPGRLAQALGNVVDNALEHGNGRVEIRAAASARTIHLELSDEGEGLPTRRPSRVRRRAGRGRGLAIATRAVEEAGGRLTIRTGSSGAVVSMELPRAEP